MRRAAADAHVWRLWSRDAHEVFSHPSAVSDGASRPALRARRRRGRPAGGRAAARGADCAPERHLTASHVRHHGGRGAAQGSVGSGSRAACLLLSRIFFGGHLRLWVFWQRGEPRAAHIYLSAQHLTSLALRARSASSRLLLSPSSPPSGSPPAICFKSRPIEHTITASASTGRRS